MKVIEDLIEEFKKIPGIGQKTATRYTYDVLNLKEKEREEFINAITNLNKVKRCKICNNYTLQEKCEYCLENRDKKTLIIVAYPRDIEKIEGVMQGRYYYYVLEGVIDPLNGVSPKDLLIEKLERRIEQENITECILILPTNNEGELTASYLKKKLEPYNLKITKLAQGIPIGGEIEYLDELTLLRSIEFRKEY